jgi:hypothetical protein
MNLGPDETDLVGKWVKDGNGVVGDEVELRIGELIAHELKKIAVNPDSGGWEVLFRDPHDGRYWELTYPQSQIHGGGPRRLTTLSPAAAFEKYPQSNHEV